MFRVALESVLRETIQGGRTLVLRPCQPAAWPGFTFRYRLPDGATRYEVVVRRTAGASVVRAPGLAARVEDGAVLVELAGDGAAHRVEVDLGVDVVTRYRPSEAPPERITSA
jgi:cyclic beta-1,2-glucan synthetase